MNQDRELLLITILKIPVKVIKWGSRLFSMLTYLPNYFIILIVDYILFHPTLDQSLFKYSIAWLPRLILLQIPPFLFWLEFYCIYKFLQLQSIESIWIQLLAMSLIVIGALSLMRKGYLSFIKRYNPAKLKSPMQHLSLYKTNVLDLFGIIIAILNSLFIVNIGKTFAYNYSPIQRRYIKHISYTLKSSLLFHVKFYYIHIFFRIFKWRYNHDIDNIKKEQQSRNVLNLFVLLSLLHILTWIDIIAVTLLGWIPLIHPQYSLLFRNGLKADYRLWRVVLKYTMLVFIQILQLALLLFGILKPRGAKAVLLKIIKATNFEEQNKIFKDLFEIIGLSLLQIPYFICFFLVLCSIYKFKKRNKLLNEIPDALKRSLNKQKITFKCLGQLFFESFFFLPILFATVVKPYNYFWLKMVINPETLNINFDIVSNYAIRCVFDVFWIPATILIVLINILYSPVASWERIKIFYKYRTTLTREQLIVRDSNASHWKPVFYTFKNKISKDIPHLLFYFYSLISGSWMIGGIYEPQQCPKKLQNLMAILYMKWVRLRRKNRFEQYIQYLKADQASGVIKNQPLYVMRFWKFCAKTERYRTFIKVLKFILPSRKVKKVQERQKPVTQYSKISNQYWNQYNLFWALIGLTIYLIINAIVTLFGIFCLFPLTLWRIPTFIVLYKKHNNRLMFFKIIFQVYRQQLFDILQLPINIICFLVSPYHYILFRWKNIFYYGQQGINSFTKAQRVKSNIIFSIFWQSIKCHIMIIQCIFVACLLIRLQNLRKTIQQDLKLKFRQLLIFYFKLHFPTCKEIMPNQVRQPSKFQKKLWEYQQKMHTVFFLALSDIPYLFILLILTTLMPWRIFYVLQVVQSFRHGDTTRKKFKTLLKNCLSDYICIFLNIVLIFTIVKAKKSLQLIFKNYRLNFFVGFLDYSYKHELFKQLREGIYFYHNVFFLVLAMLFDWPNALNIFNKVYSMYKDRKEKERKELMELQMKQKLVKENKTNLLSMMGFNSFAIMTQFLHPIQIAYLSEVNKMAYCLIKQSDIWQLQWERLYQEKYKNVIKSSDNYKMMVIEACKLEKKVPIKKQIITYQELILSQLYHSFRQAQLDVKYYSQKIFSQAKFQQIFNVQAYTIQQGFRQRQVQLNEQQRNQRQIRRLLNQPEPEQLQQPQVQVLQDQYQAYAYWLILRPVQWLSKWPDSLFTVNTHRRKKQLLSILIPTILLISYVLFWWHNFIQVFRATTFISVRLMLLIYFHFLAYVLGIRIHILIPNWVSLRPFDLKEDFINFCRYIKRKIIEKKQSFKNWVKNKILIPIKNAYIRVKNYLYQKYTAGKTFFINRVYTPTKNKLLQVLNYIKEKIIWISKKIWAAITWVFKKIWEAIKWVWGKIVKFAKYFFQKVALPLYLSIVDKLKKLWELCKELARLFSLIFKKILQLIKTLMKGIYNFIKLIIRNLNTLYRSILGGLMGFFLKFGIVGELIFTLLGLFIMSMPISLCLLFYNEKWVIVCSSIWTMGLILSGYRHLNELKTTINRK